MRESGFRHTESLTRESIDRRVRAEGVSNELQAKLEAHARKGEGAEPSFALAQEYLADNFTRFADGLRGLRGTNDPEVNRRRSVGQLFRRKEVINSLREGLRTESFTDLERDQLLWMHDMATAFLTQISKSVGLFTTQYGMSNERAGLFANLSAAEMQQNLTEMMLRRARQASDVSSDGPPAERRFVEETILPLYHTMVVRALGLEEGERLYTIMENGLYASAAAYLMYSDAKLNRFHTSFKVIVPSPYLDAIEQTDLLLVNQANLTPAVRDELEAAFAAMHERDERGSIDGLSPAAKQHVYKVQVKSRASGPRTLTSEEVAERDRFISARCRSKGFDNYDYLVLNTQRARNIVNAVR